MLRRLGEYLRLIKTEPLDVYCQTCGREITQEGADVSSSGEIYCHGGDGPMCAAMATLKSEATRVFNYYKPREVQRAIRRKQITNFSPLEQEARKAASTQE